MPRIICIAVNAKTMIKKFAVLGVMCVKSFGLQSLDYKNRCTRLETEGCLIDACGRVKAIKLRAAQ